MRQMTPFGTPPPILTHGETILATLTLTMAVECRAVRASSQESAELRALSL